MTAIQIARTRLETYLRESLTKSPPELDAAFWRRLSWFEDAIIIAARDDGAKCHPPF